MNNPMGTPDDERLRALLHDAVADVEPADGLAAVRRRTRTRRPAVGRAGRRWLPALVGAGAVGATVVAATFVVSGLGDGPDDTPPVAGSSTSSATPSDHPITRAAGVYYVADTPTGPRLFREFHAVGQTDDPAELALLALQRLSADVGPFDPDYRTVWPAGSFADVTVEDDQIVVELGTEAALAGTGTREEPLGVQQAVYTAEAALGERLPVAFRWQGAPARRVLGQRVGPRVERDTSYALTAPVNITDPAENLAVEDGSFAANGTLATSARGVRWALRKDGRVVLEGAAKPADITGPDARATLGAPGWETGEIDVSDLPPGAYELLVSVIDTGQTSDGPQEFTDTRTVTVR